MVLRKSPKKPRPLAGIRNPLVVGEVRQTDHHRGFSLGSCGLFVMLCVGILLGGCTRSSAPTKVTGKPAASVTPKSVSKTEPSNVETNSNSPTGAEEEKTMSNENGLATATFASGCYWCTEAVFQRLDGVENVVSGAMGGHVENPTYHDICTGTTGHAECIQFNYDPAKVSYETLLEVFWKTHDPTTLNMQGADVGPQYRSAVFYHTDEQRELAEKYKKKLDAAGVFDNPIVTEITEASQFYTAKADHQNFYNQNPNHGYCSYVIRPKLEKLEAVFADKLKKSQ